MFKKNNSVNVTSVAESKKLIKRAQNQFDFQFTPRTKKAQGKNQSFDFQKKHRIYDRLISLLESKRFADLPFVLHEQTKTALRADGMTETEISELENSIIGDVPIQRHSSTIPSELHSELIRQKKSRQIFDRRIVNIPDEDLNLSICDQLEKEFSRSDLLNCPGFVLEDDLFLMLDIGGHLVERGFIIPRTRQGLIVALEVFRNAYDNSPFLLRSRAQGVSLCR